MTRDRTPLVLPSRARRSPGFIEPCLPTPGHTPCQTGAQWEHEISGVTAIGTLHPAPAKIDCLNPH